MFGRDPAADAPLDAATFEELKRNLAVQQIEAALATLRDAGDASSAADYVARQLPDARALAQKLAKRRR